MSRFHIIESLRLMQKIKRRPRHIVQVDRHTLAVTYHVFQFTAALHHAARHQQGQTLLRTLGMFRIVGSQIAAQTFDGSLVLSVLYSGKVIIQKDGCTDRCLECRFKE